MKLLLAATIDDWHDLAPTRSNQVSRSGLAQALRIVADQISNNSANDGGVTWPGVSVHFELELEPAAKPEADEAA